MGESSVSLLPLGAIIQILKINGLNIVQGFPTQDLYADHNSPYFGETIGRVANRVADAKINDVNGESYTLTANDGPNTLHGGPVGWGKRIWDGPKLVGIRKIPGIEGMQGGETIQFSLLSQDGEEGFPGALDVNVIYTTGTQQVEGKEVTVLAMEYEAQLVGGADETIINMTNHSYFNLSGDPTIDGTVVSLSTSNHLPVDTNSIPTGNPVTFPGIDTHGPFTLGAVEPKIDHCFTLATQPAAVPIDTRNEPLTLNVKASHPKTGIHLEVLSTEPSYQFYTGDFTDVPAVGGMPARGARSAFCCEPGRYVNACNVPEWKGMVLLKKNQTYGSRIVYRAWAA